MSRSSWAVRQRDDDHAALIPACGREALCFENTSLESNIALAATPPCHLFNVSISTTASSVYTWTPSLEAPQISLAAIILDQTYSPPDVLHARHPKTRIVPKSSIPRLGRQVNNTEYIWQRILQSSLPNYLNVVYQFNSLPASDNRLRMYIRSIEKWWFTGLRFASKCVSTLLIGFHHLWKWLKFSPPSTPGSNFEMRRNSIIFLWFSIGTWIRTYSRKRRNAASIPNPRFCCTEFNSALAFILRPGSPKSMLNSATVRDDG